MNKLARKGLRTWIEVDTKAIKHNFSIFRSLIHKNTKLMAVIKSNAYGHSLVDFAKEMEHLGADFLGVDSIVEGLTLRKEKIKTPILVLGYTLPEMIHEACENNIAVSISNFENLNFIAKNFKTFSKPLSIHIKVDTGMHRQGFVNGDLGKVLKILKSLDSKIVKVEGLFTHFAAAKNPAFPGDTVAQINEFKIWLEQFKNAGFKPIAHAAATSGALIFPDAHFDMVRIGIGLYGLWPSREVKAFLEGKVVLKPVLAWKTIISEIKQYKNGGKIGYDLTEVLPPDATVGIIPIGYWHGYPRVLSSIGKVLVSGVECRVLGRVSMDMVCIDLSKVTKAKVGDEVTIASANPDSLASMQCMSEVVDLSWYETVTRLNPLIKRFYI